MAVFRINKNKDYTIMGKYHLREKNMSLKAKGLLSVMLSLPDDWDYSVEGLVSICEESKTSIQAILKELEDNKYLVRKRLQNDKGQFIYEYNIYEKPYTEEPWMDYPCTDYPCTENKPQLNNNKLNTKELNTNEYKEKNIKKESVNSVIAEYTENKDLQDALHGFVEMRTKARKPLTVRAMKLSLNVLDNLAVDDVTKIAIVNQSIVHTWSTFYKLQNNNNGGQRQLTRKEMGYAF